MNTEQKHSPAPPGVCAPIDQHCAQRYTVFNAFLNLYIATGNNFYKGCAETFLYDRSPFPASQ